MLRNQVSYHSLLFSAHVSRGVSAPSPPVSTLKSIFRHALLASKRMVKYSNCTKKQSVTFLTKSPGTRYSIFQTWKDFFRWGRKWMQSKQLRPICSAASFKFAKPRFSSQQQGTLGNPTKSPEQTFKSTCKCAGKKAFLLGEGGEGNGAGAGARAGARLLKLNSCRINDSKHSKGAGLEKGN